MHVKRWPPWRPGQRAPPTESTAWARTMTAGEQVSALDPPQSTWGLFHPAQG